MAQLSHSVVYHDEKYDENDLVVFDLSKREVLTADILKAAINKLTDSKHFGECEGCPLNKNCDVHKNRKLLKTELFQERLFVILQRVAMQGYHATIRELQSFISYLIFGNRSCSNISRTTGSNQYNIVNLIYSGKSALFNNIKKAIDPINISHPVWDEKILANDIPTDSWVSGYEVPAETIAYDNIELFKLRKRQFYFFNIHGDELLKILDDDVTRFQTFLNQDSSKIIKELIRKLNAFFGAVNPSNSELQIWSGFRYDNEPRKVLISMSSIKKSGLTIGRPSLLTTMQNGIDMTSSYIRLEKKDDVVKNPTDTDIQLLFDEAAYAEQSRQQFLRNEMDSDSIDTEKSDLGRISKDTEAALFHRKRAEQLARLLSAKKTITRVCNSVSNLSLSIIPQSFRQKCLMCFPMRRSFPL